MRSEEEIRKQIKEDEKKLDELKRSFEMFAVASYESRIAALEWVLGESDSPFWG